MRSAHRRHGIGSALLRPAIAWAERMGGDALYLTTYRHLPWNRPFYERARFRVIDERVAGAELRAILREQRAALPDPGERVAMARPLGAA